MMPHLTLKATSSTNAMHPRMDASEVADRITVMRRQEEAAYRGTDYLAENEFITSRSNKPVDKECRAMICEWFYQVVDSCKLGRETVAISMSCLDRYLSTDSGRKALLRRKTFQLVAITSLFISIKVNEPFQIQTSLLVYASRGYYTEAEITAMETDILTALEWRINGPTPQTFITHFLELLPECVDPDVAGAIKNYAHFLAEISVTSYSFAVRTPSSVALAAILNAMAELDYNVLPMRTRGAFLRSVEQASEIMIEEVESVQVSLTLTLDDVLASELAGLIRSLSCNHKEEVVRESSRKSPRSPLEHESSPVCIASKRR